MSTPLAGLVVLDLTSGPAGGLATMILSDFGARVIRFSDPRFDELNRAPAARMWRRGKEEARAPLHSLVRDADVVVISHPNGFSGSNYTDLHRINPALVYAEFSAFGDDTPVPAAEPVVAAKLGRMKGLEGVVPRPGPAYSAVQVATHATAQNLVSGILAALHERARSGVGQKVTTSLASGLVPFDQGASLATQVRRARGEPEPDVPLFDLMPTLNYHPVQCADGRWLQLGNLLPHLFLSFMRVIGLEGEMARLPAETESVRDAILLRMQEKTCAEWMQLFVADGGVAAHPYQTAEQALTDPDMTSNGHAITLDGVRQLGPLTTLVATPADIGGSQSGERWGLPGPDPVADTAPPLRNIVVLELATIIAAPLAASFLADLGARVIKVETVGGDPYRSMAGGFGATRCNQGKESIGVDLKSEAGRAVIHRLVKQADIVIHNFRPGVPERLGIGYEVLKSIQPSLIYVSANGYGPKGPGAHRPSTHPIPGAAMGGAGYQAGGTPPSKLTIAGLRETSRRLMRANEVNPDPNTALVIATSALLALVARDRTGLGQQVFGDMFIANGYANFDDLVAYSGKPPRRPLGDQLFGPDPLHRLYPCKTGWVCLAIDKLEDWEKFGKVVAATHLTAHYPSPLPAGPAELGEELAALFLSNTAAHFERLLLAAGIGCASADEHNLSGFFLSECHEHSRFMVRVPHPVFGSYYRHRPMLVFSRSHSRAGPGVTGGANTRAIMAELGFPASETEFLFAQGVLWTELDHTA